MCGTRTRTMSINYTDPRVIRRFKRALNFVGTRLGNNTRSLFHKHIQQELGHSSDKLGKFLRDPIYGIITEVNSHYNMHSGKTKQYKMNRIGYQSLYKQIYGIDPFCNTQHQTVQNITLQTLIEQCSTNYGSQLSTGLFTYEKSENRLWHPLQNVSNEYRRHLFAHWNYRYIYDIDCCAPTLLLQHALSIDPNVTFPHIQDYIENKNSSRKHIMNIGRIDDKTAKKFINALFYIKCLSPKADSIMSLLNNDFSTFYRLTRDVFIVDLRTDISRMWKLISTSMKRTTIVTKKGHRLVPINARDKANVYFELEKQVMNIVINHLYINGLRSFIEHDGWVCDGPIDESVLCAEIYKKTKFIISLKSVILDK